MLFLVLVTMQVGFRVAEKSLLIVKMGSHLELEIREGFSAGETVANFSDGIKQLLVFIIKPLVKHLKTVIPNVRLGNIMGHETNVVKVSVLEVLHHHSVNLLVLIGVGLIHRLLKHALLIVKVVLVLDDSGLQVLLIVLPLDEKDSVEEASVLIINSWQLNSE